MPLVNVVSMDGKERHIEIDGDDTVENIKYKVADITGIPYRLQKLIYEDKELKDNVKVIDIIGKLITREFTVHLMVKAGIMEKDIIDNSYDRSPMIIESGVVPPRNGNTGETSEKRSWFKCCTIL
eukprot:TRINITY_DN3214_c0_g1_i4.p1 TRINITY_DN3214_c0_g1~~TRINITY_DN3214_c0_g1_i4.p1  ORF type:complete len:125 (+),score=16.32 TRINITY_DN3214_c0_g1_i4:347-721(+)